jgi:hypothetical protein
VTPRAAGALRLRDTRGPTRRARHVAVAAILLALAAAAGDCAGRAPSPDPLAAEVGP